MSDDRYNTREQMTKEEAYEEYLRLRQGARKAPSVTATPYGASELRKRAKQQEAERQRQAYLEERERSSSSRKRERSSSSRKEEPLFRNADRRPRASRPPKQKSKKKRALRIALVVLIILILAAGGVAAGVYGVATSTLNKIGRLDIDRNALEISPTAESNLKDYTNIAVLGVDARDVDDDKDSRSDAIVIVSINNKTNEVKMFSVFRDTLLDLGGDVGLDKVTHAYFYGGAENTLKALNKNLDLNIERVVVINWKTVAEIIDTLGGIKINVQESEVEEMNKYIPGTAKTTGSEAILITEPGKQKLNGAQAVTYARIRKDAATGDYRRNERMKIVMKKTFQKAKKADLLTLKDICDNAFPQAKTNITTREMMAMGLKFKKYDMTSSTTGWPYDVEGWMGYAGAGYAWYGPPVTLSSNVSKLYDKFFDISDYEPTETVRSISDSISVLTGLY